MRQAAARQPLPGERAQAHAWWLQRALWFGGVNVLVGSCGMELVVHLVPGSYSLIFLWKPWLLTRVRATVLILPEAEQARRAPRRTVLQPGVESLPRWQPALCVASSPALCRRPSEGNGANTESHCPKQSHGQTCVSAVPWGLGEPSGRCDPPEEQQLKLFPLAGWTGRGAACNRSVST